MLEKLDLTKTLSKEEYKEKKEEVQLKLGMLQRECKEEGIPVMAVFEGYDAAGKGFQIGRLMQGLDPRGFQVFAVEEESKEEKRYPFMRRFWTKTPEKGRIAIFDGSWYRKVLEDRFDGMVKKKSVPKVYESIRSFEHQLTDDGTIIVKLFLTISKKEQKRRFKKLLESKETAWRVRKRDIKRNQKFTQYTALIEEMLQKTDTDFAPWILVEATDRNFAEIKCYQAVIQAMTDGLARRRQEAALKKPDRNTDPENETAHLRESMLNAADLTLAYDKVEYSKKLKKLQKKIEMLHGELYRRRIPVIIGFEGWDAGGKGGAIKRLTEHMDPRGYVVHPTAAPNDDEKAHHYLWRFWRVMPKAGHVAVFDRTWYGRVMVERIEGFCSKSDWQRAYKEITDMERDLCDSGALVLKFWMQIDKEEQERRFLARQDNPDKQWKITDEDWRNREKWDLYEEAVDEMLIRTSTEHAPWIVVEGNNKYYARIKVLQTVVKAIEERLASAGGKTK